MKNLVKLFVITTAMSSIFLSSDVFAGQLSVNPANNNFNGNGSGAMASGNVTANLNNDNTTALNVGGSMSIVPFNVAFTSVGPMDFGWRSLNSGGTSEYSLKQLVGMLDGTIVNNTGEDWTDFHWQLGYGTGDNFIPSTIGDFLDFDTPDRDPIPTSTVFTNVDHQANELTFTGGTVANGAGVGFNFNFDVPDLNNGIPDAYHVGSDAYDFTIRARPSTDFNEAPAIPEPSTYLLMGLGLLGAGFYRKLKK